MSEHEPISFANDGSLWNGYLSYEELDINIKFENGSFAGLDSGLYGNDGVRLSYFDLSDERKSALTEVVNRWFTTSNGIDPEFDSNGLIPYIEEHNSNLADALNRRQMSSENIRSITMFNGGKLSDGIRVLTNSILGIGTSGEMEQKFKEFYEQNNLLPTDEIYPLFYSGSSDAGLQTLVKNNYNAPVVFAVGAFNSFTHIDNDSINTFVNILGQNDSFGRLTDYRNSSNIETINVVFQGNVKHSTYWDDNRYDSLIAEMRAEAVNNSPQDFKQFLMNSGYYVAEENWNEVVENHVAGLEKRSSTENIRETVIVLELPDAENT